MTVFIRLLDSSVESKPEDLLRAVGAFSREGGEQAALARVFERAPRAFDAIPGSPFGYWVSSRLLERFKEMPAFEAQGRVARRTNGTTDDGRWIRLSWEVERSPSDWKPHAKGGAYSEYWADLHLVIAWDERRSTYPGYLGTEHRPDVRPASMQYFFRPGLTWSRRSQKGFSMRALPRDTIFGDKGPGCFHETDAADELLAALAITNSSAFRCLLALQMAFGSYEAGVVQSTPYPGLDIERRELLAGLARRCWSLKRCLDAMGETSLAFLLPYALHQRATGTERNAVERELVRLRQQIDDEAFSLYGFESADRVAALEGSATSNDAGDDAANDDDDDSGEDETSPGDGRSSVTSWLVGVAFGRFDPRLATAERAIPPEPEPFDPLPARSPGMYPEGEEPADRPDILVDDEGHADDLAARAIAVAERVKVDELENLRAWLAKEFFPLHIKMYSKSRRKAPIYWQLATPSASYSVWLYIHAFSKDTLFRVQNDYVAPKLSHEERRLESLTSELRDGATPAQRKTLAAQEAVVDELRAFLDEVKRIAPLWKPNLDDGVIINFAPLWRLVPQNKSWQKELKSTWDALCEGKYDWAHLAMHLWPERVVPKCAKDRSLAIAHGLEDVFWVEGTDGKWAARKTPTRSVDELVRQRTSPAVKSALKSLLEAPAAAGKSGGRRGGGRRKSAAAAEGGDA